MDLELLRVKNYGTLRLFVYEMNDGPALMATKGRGTTPSIPEPVIREAFEPRALTHKVRYKHVVSESQISVPKYTDNYEDELRRPCAIYEFRYRSKSKSRPPFLISRLGHHTSCADMM